MVYAFVALLGIIAWNRLPREFMPNLDFPQLMVITSYPNASSQEIETLITKVVEEASGTVAGVKRIHSVSKEGVSLVTVEFQWGTDMDFASLNLREKIDLIKIKLPREAEEPRIERFNPFALPVTILSLSGSRDALELLKIAKRPVTELLEKVPGVAAVSITGGAERQILVDMDQNQLAAHHLPIMDVVEAVKEGNITYPAGNLKDATYDYVVRIDGAVAKPEDLANIIVKVDREKILPSAAINRDFHQPEKQSNQENTTYGGPQVIKLGTLASIKDTVKDRSSYSRYDHKENIALAILKQGDANIVRVADAVKDRLADIQAKLPAGVKLELIYDQSQYIKTGIEQMIESGLIGALLAFLVLYLFLGSTRQAAIVAAAIPTSVLATLFLLYMQGITLNTVSLAGLAIGIGLLVDGAIVVIENITRYQQAGEAPSQAAEKGAQEMLGAVASSIGTTLVVFLPLIFVLGIIGQVFKDLSWAIVYSQLASLAVAFTLIPMLAGLGKGTVHSRPAWHGSMVNLARKLQAGMNRLIQAALAHPAKTLVLTLALWLISATLLWITVPKGLFPKVDQDEFILALTMPIGSKLSVTNSTTEKIESVLSQIKEVHHQLVAVGSMAKEGVQALGPHEAQIVVSLSSKRQRSADEIMQTIKEQLAPMDLGGGIVNFKSQENGISALASDSDPVMVELKGYDLTKMKAINDRLIRALRQVPGITNIKSNLSLNAPEIGLKIKRDDAAAYNLSVADLAKSLLTAIRGTTASKYREEGKEIDITVRLREDQRNSQEALNRLLVRSPLKVTLPLEAVADIQPELGPSEILRLDQQRTVVVSAGLFKHTLEQVTPDLNAILKKIRDDYPDFAVALSGETLQMKESFNSLTGVLIISLLLVFMIMAALFESLWQPLLILLTVPLALIGMAPALLATGHAFSAMAGMGLVLLCGIVVNNGIVLIDYVNQHRPDHHGDLRQTLLQACHIRLRPIVMTAATTVLGMLPLALGLGKGTQMQAPMAVVVVSGLFVSTFLTLLVLPAMMVVVEEKIVKKKPVMK